MSHILTMKLEVKDLTAAEQAAEAVGCELIRGQKTIRSYQTNIRCDHAIRVKGDPRAYEAALVKRADGKGYDIAFDNFSDQGRALERCLGPNAERFANHYGARVAVARMSRKGFRVSITEDKKTGEVKAVCRK